MFNHKSPDILKAEIEMTRAKGDCAVLLVEGPGDEKFWIPRCECELVVGEGKPNVLGCMEQLDSGGYVGVLGLVDDDFDHVLNIQWSSPNLVATDASDLECLLCRSDALERVLAEYGDPDRIERFVELNGTSVRDALLARALAFGRLRWAERRFGIQISWKDLGGIQRFVEADSWKLDEGRLIEVASRVSGLDQISLVNFVGGLPRTADPWYVARGHDVVELLRIGLRNALGRVKSTVGADDVASWLRLAFSRPALDATGLARQIRCWEGRNVPYGILAP